MALIDSEGFGWTTNSADLATYGAFSGTLFGGIVSNGSGPYGDNYLQTPIVGLTRGIPGAPSSFFLGFRMNFSGSPRNCGIYGTSGWQFTWLTQPDGSINFYTGFLDTLLGSTAPGVLIVNTWQYFEVGGTVNPTGGTVTCRVGGVPVFTVAGVNTSGQGSGGANSMVWGSSPANTFDSIMHYYACNASGTGPWNTFLGDVRVQTLKTISDASAAFTPVGQPLNYENTSTQPPAPGSDYNQSSTVGAIDEFGMTQTGAGIITVLGVHLKGIYGLQGTGTRSMENLMVSGVTSSPGSSNSLSSSASQFRTMYEKDPNTSAEWTTAAVDAMTPGYKISA